MANSSGGLQNISGNTFDPEPDSTSEKIFSSINIITGLIGLIGNFTVCLVTVRLKDQKVNMLIVTQAIVDLLASLVLVILTITNIVSAVPTNAILGYLYCFLWQSRFILYFLFAVSTFNLVAISLERYVAVLHPILYANNLSRKKVFVLAALAWVFGPIMEVIHAIITVVEVQNGECAFHSWNETTKSAVGVLIFLWQFFIPCIIMGFCFTRIALELQKRGKRRKKMEIPTVSAAITTKAKGTAGNSGLKQSAASSASMQTRNVTITLITVFAVYVICWSTDNFLFLQYNLGGYIDFNGPLYGFAVTMAILNSACNPIIYAFRYDQYRKELKELFAGCNHNLCGVDSSRSAEKTTKL
ncbi:rhodopsin, GQ-coupled-like [Amphiura filiformis]|uniref:rhodopsin, GQ-coupled-like n=1 Tax=Amphiura filiformis TaxID=82378 RepID=UPI003B211BB4